MKNKILQFILVSFIFFLLGAFSLNAQTITSPSNNPGYNAMKANLAAQNQSKRAGNIQNQAVVKAKPNQFKSKVFSVARNSNQSNFSPTLKTQQCFIEPDGTYTSFPGNDDDYIGPFALPFNFNLYGTNYTQVWVNNNGNITFTGGLTAFTASGFPISNPMVAAFWSDVDTRPVGSALTQYKINATNMIVTWNGVGYFGQHIDLLNYFQLIITDGNDPLIGIGNNVAFYYKDMQWTTGDASSGSGGFGGTPATVGVNKGDLVNYLQVGRFGIPGNAYDGPGGATDGIDYLDYACHQFNVTNLTNQPPSVSGNPPGNTVVLNQGDVATIPLYFIGPEIGQNVITTINTNGLCNTTTSITNGTLSTATSVVTASLCNIGTHHIIYTASDDFNPAGTTTVDITVIINPPLGTIPTLSEWGLIILGLVLMSLGIFYIYKRRTLTV